MRKRNLFTGDVSYQQRWSLDFSTPATEQRHQADTARLVSPQLVYLTCLFTAAALLQVGPKALTVAVCLLLCSSLQGRDVYRLRLAWSLPVLLLSYLVWQEDQQWSETEELLRQFPGFLASKGHTGFFTIRQWPAAVLFAVGEGAVFVAFSGVVWTKLAGPAVLYLGLYCYLQKDLKDLWTLADSFRRSDQHHKDILNGAIEAYFVTDLEGVVLYTNTAGRHLAAALNVPAIRYGYSSLFLLFQEENAVKLQDILKSSARLEADEKELIIKRLPAGPLDVRQVRGLGVQVRSQPFTWREKPAILFAFEDVSLYIARRLFLTSIYRQLHTSVIEFSKELEVLHKMKHSISAKELFSFYQLHTEYGNSLLLQYYILGRVEMRKEPFHLRTEVENVMEFVSFRAYHRNIDLYLTREEGFPAAVYADKLRHTQLLTNLLTFVVDQAKEGSEVGLYCAVGGAQEGEFILSYRVNFSTTKLTQADLEELLVTRKGETRRRGLNEVIELTENFGVGILVFDMLLQVLRGVVSMAYVEGRPGKATIMFTVPVQTHSSTVQSTPLTLSTGKQTASPLSTRWKAGNLHFLSSASLPEFSVGSAPKLKRGQSDMQVIPPRKLSSRVSGEIERFSPQPPPLSTHPAGFRSELSSSSSSSSESAEEPAIIEGRSRDSLQIRQLELSEHSQRASFAAHDPPRRPHLSQKILVVDENPYVRRILKTAAARNGYTDCDEAKDKTEALQMYRVMSLQESLYAAIFVTTGKASGVGESLVRDFRSLETASDFPRTLVCGIPAVTGSEAALYDCFSKVYAVTRPSSESELREVLRKAAGH